MGATVLDAGVLIGLLAADDHPTRRGPYDVDAFCEQVPVRMVDVDRDVARAAAAPCAQYGKALTLPDAFVLATAQLAGEDAEVLTADGGWPDVGVRVLVLT